MEDLNCTRKIDSMGRITIPIRLREQFGFEIGQEYSFCMHTDPTGAKYLCLRCPQSESSEIKDAINLLEELGYEVTPGY